ncbi:hypothetical protein F5Y07DRAFT_391026 [Xylaria sp. FL0933]|nr:hypothetical protein F5Y07DRAFT_391026 [Xylaria sp. FL0933]
MNPGGVATVLMIIGGDIVQKALAQTTGCLYTPVCFSFRWVAYAFIALVGVLGDGKLLPPPDYAIKVFNLGSGYCRDNKNWILGRIFRDIETYMSREEPMPYGGIRISVWEATENLHRHTQHSQSSIANFALASGNGSKDVVIILGKGSCLDKKPLATGNRGNSLYMTNQASFQSPGRVRPVYYLIIDRTGNRMTSARVIWGLPSGFWITLCICVVQSLAWLVILITAALAENTWFPILAGVIGTFQNACLAAIERPPKRRNLPLQHVETIMRQKFMDGLMDLEVGYGCGSRLVCEFLPERKLYDEIRS